MNIPLTRPYWGKSEERAVLQALRSKSAAGDGTWTAKLRDKIKLLTKAKYVFSVTSCTHGLELAMLALNIKPGDEVIMPSFTMTSTANCVVLRGGIPVFADLESTTFGLNPRDVEKKINKKTKGIICVHYAGMPCMIDELLKITHKHKLFLVEDAAHALGAFYHDKALGTFGDIGVYSLHGTKNISSGEGGIVVTDSQKLADLMAIFRVNGTNRQAFIDGQVAKYSWVTHGSSYLLAEPLAAIAVAQVDKIKEINQKRAQIAKKYQKKFSIDSRLRGNDEILYDLPVIPRSSTPNWHIYALKFKTSNRAKEFKEALNKKGIAAALHYVPLHSSPMGKKIKADKVELPVTDEVSQTLVRLPIYPGLTKPELHYIISSAQKVLQKLQNNC